MEKVQILPVHRIRPSPRSSNPATVDKKDFQTPLALRFAQAVSALGSAARDQNLTTPSFRSPPRLANTDRTIIRHSNGTATVSVCLSGRPWQAVLADLVEGVVVANDLSGSAAMRARSTLWASVASELPTAAA